MSATEQAESEFRSIKAAFATLRKLGYSWDGGQFWVPPSETEDEAVIRNKPGWYEVWQVRNGKKRSMDSYAYVAAETHFGILYFTLDGSRRGVTPTPFADQKIGFVRCKPPFKELSS